jgi:lysozyme
MRAASLRYTLAVPAFALLAACSAPPDSPTAEPAESTSQATTVCGQTQVKGMDVSHYDGTIDWPTAKSAGISFAIAKATESTTYVDPTFATNWAAMKSHGIVRAAYHFFRANTDPVQQANHAMQTIGALDAGDLPIVLDLETMDGETGATVAANALAFLDAVTQGTGKKAIVYTSPAFIAGLSGTAGFAKYTLWVANWGVSCPNVPSPWTTWAFWQDSSTGTVNGVPSTAVDLDVFNGTLGQLQGFGGGAPDAGAHDGGKTGDAGSSSDGGSGGPAPDGGVPPSPDAGGIGSPPPGDNGANAGGSFSSDSGQSGGCAVSLGTTSGVSPFAMLALLLFTRSLRRAPRPRRAPQCRQ